MPRSLLRILVLLARGPARFDRATFPLMLLTLLVASGSAAAQSLEVYGPRGNLAFEPARARPSLMPPLYYMLAPGAALLVAGGIMWSQHDPSKEEHVAVADASIFLMIAGATGVLGSVPYLGARVGKRRRWAAQRRWEACGPKCKVTEPALYHAAYMLLPGITMTIAGAGFLLYNFMLSESSGTLPDDPELGYGEPYITLASTCAVVGTTLVVAGLVHLVARAQMRTAWRQRNDARSSMRVQPTMANRSGAAANYSFGLAMSGRF